MRPRAHRRRTIGAERTAGSATEDAMSADAPAAPSTGRTSSVLLTLVAGQFLMTLDSSVMNVAIATVAALRGLPCACF
jgi:hypothetical protein